MASATDANGNGVTFNPNASLPYYTITAINGATITLSQSLTSETNVTVSLAPVSVVTTHNTVTIDNYNPYAYDPNFTYLMTPDQVTGITGNIKVWTPDELLSGISAGLLEQTTSTQVNIEAPNITADNIVITASANIGTLINPVTNEVGFVPGQILTDGSPAQLALAAAARTDLNFLTVAPANVVVNFGTAANGDGTMTLANNAAWSSITNSSGQSLNIAAGQELYIGGTTQNATENGAYLTVLSVSGSTVTFAPGQRIASESSQSVLVASVVVTTNQSTAGTASSAVLNFGNFNNSGTITLANGGSWTGYTVGEGIFIGSASDPNANSVNFNANAANPYYTITAINGSTITVQGKLKAETGATVNVAPVTIDVNLHANQIGFVLISQNKDVAVAPSGSLTATAGGFIYIGSQVNLEVDTVVAGTTGNPADIRLKTQGDLINNLPPNHGSSTNAQGGHITLEAGQGFIGTSADPFQVDILGTGDLTARALDDIYITAPVSNIPVNAIYTESGGVYLVTTQGSIYDAVSSDFAKIQGNIIELKSGDQIGNSSGNALHIDIAGTDPVDGLRAVAQSNINIDAPDGNLNVLGALSISGDVTLGAAVSIVNVGNLADPKNVNSALSSTDLGANVYGNNVVLDAGQSGLGGIGGRATYGTDLNAAVAFNVVSGFSGAGTLSATGVDDNIYLDEVTSAIWPATTSNSLKANGDMVLLFISDVNAIAFLTAASGNILNGNTTNSANIVSGAADLSANGDIGSGTLRPGNLTGRIVSTVANVDAQSSTGSIYLWNIGALIVGKVNNVSTPYALYAPEGLVDVQTSSPLEISQNILAENSITKQAGTVAAADDNLTVDPGITIQSLTSSITLQAGNNIWLEGQGANAAKLEAVTGVTLEAGNYDTASIAGAAIDATVNFGTDVNGNPTMTLATANTSWSNTLAVGDRVLIQSVVGGSTTNLTRGDDYLTITGITAGTSTSGGVITFAPTTTFTTETNEAIAVSIDPAASIAATVNFAESSGIATMSLAALNTSWDPSLVVGDEIDIGGSTSNNTQGDQYLLISSITNGTATTHGVIVFAAGQTVTNESNANITITPVLRDVRIDPGVIIDTTNVPENTDFTPTGDPAYPTSAITIDSSGTVNISGAANGVAAPVLSAARAINLNAAYLSGATTPGFSNANVTLDLFGNFNARALNVTTGGGDDDVEFSPTALTADATIDTGAGDDLIHVFKMPSLLAVPTTAAAAQISNVVNLDGQDGADEYVVDATAATNYIINVSDTGALDSGENSLIINGADTTSGQSFLVRDSFVAIVESNGASAYQRINYDDTITGGLTINGGDVTDPTTAGDSYYLDGNSAVMTINAGNGLDFFQIGQVYDQADVGSAAGDVGALAGDSLTTTLTTVGDLSDGVDKATVLYGGSGTDTFEVYSNKADLSLIGGSGDDTFIVRAFLVAAGTHIGVQGGSGNDTIEYNIDAPVDIEGGTGFNTLVLLGTEADDTFVITKDGIFGGGLNIAYTNIQAITIDGLEGDDTFYVLSTPQDVVTTINGGEGGDTVDIGGDVTNAVISASSQGTSSVTDQTVTSSNPNSAFNGVFVPGIGVTVGASGTDASIISQPSQSIVHVNDPTSTTSFTVSAPPELLSGQVAYVNVTPALPSAEWASEGATGLEVSTDGGHTWAPTATLEFIGGTTGTQTVLLRAIGIPSDDTYSRNETIVVASSIISTDNPALDSIILPTVKVTLETSVTGLIVDQGLQSTTITGGATSADQIPYSYQVSLNKKPAAGETVTVALTGPGGAALPSDLVFEQNGVVLPTNSSGQPIVTFNASNYNVPQTITVFSTLTGSHGAITDDIVQSISTSGSVTPVYTDAADAGDVKLTIAATDAPGVQLIEPQGEATVTATQPYSYQMVLTQAPAAGETVTVSIKGDGQTVASSTAPGFNAANQTITFNSTDWNVPVTITLSVNPSYVAPSGGNQGSNPTTDLTFPNQPHTLAQINGPLIIDGGTQAGQPTLVAAVALPYETRNTPVSEPILQGEGVGSGAVDVVNVFDDGATTGQTGTLTDIPAADEFGTPVDTGLTQFFSGQGINISGLDLPASNQDISHTSGTTGITTTYEGGIDMVNIDVLQILMGTGNDTFNINTPVATTNADDGLQTMMVVEGGGGSNTINVTHSLDPLVLYGNESASGIEYNSTERQTGIADGNGVVFTNFGSDTINASGATGTVVIVGGPNNDRLIGGSGTNWIAGGEGDDTISASGAVNYIFGDSSFTVGEVISVQFDGVTSSALDLASRLLTIDNDVLPMDANVNGGVQSAGGDSITVTGNGTSFVFGDYGIIDIASQSTPGVVDPFADLSQEVITKIASVNTALGGDDTINVNNVDSTDVVIGGAGDDDIILGSGGRNVVIGDNGEIDYTASGQVISGLPTQVTFGNVSGAGTITLTQGGSWAGLGYTVGEGIFIGSPTDPNSNGTAFNASATKPYYTIAAIDGATLTLNTGETLTAETAVTVNLSPVTIDTQNSANSSLSAVPSLVSFGNSSGAGTITMIDGESWAALGYAVGEGIFVGSSINVDANGATFNPTSSNPYYTIAAINGATLTLLAGQTLTPEISATVNFSPVAINIVNGTNKSTLTGVSTQPVALTSIEFDGSGGRRQRHDQRTVGRGDGRRHHREFRQFRRRRHHHADEWRELGGLRGR